MAERTVAAPPPAASAASPVPATATSADAAGLPLFVPRERLPRLVVHSLGKRVLGRRAARPDIERIVREVGPIVDAASRQPSAQAGLARIARDHGISREEARRRWVRMQEADLLLESGGDPDALSASYAAGVAQWLASTGKANGLKVDKATSDRLTRQIDNLRWRVAWAEYRQSPDADPSAPGAPPTVQADVAALPALRGELDRLRAARRRVDDRYDLQKAIFAQTRYLLRLYPRFPSYDWVFQAYHGGEGGVNRTLQKFLGSAWPGASAAAIRRAGGGHPLPFEDLYFATTPTARPAAFDYLYGRSDDHRYYWWKLRAAQEAIALFRDDPAAFQRRWESYLPGRTKEAYWHPDGPKRVYDGLDEIRAALERSDLQPVGPRAEYILRPPLLAKEDARWHAALRPEAKGALLLIAANYRRHGGTGRLMVGDMTHPAAYGERLDARYPEARRPGPIYPPAPKRDLPGGGPPEDFDYHATGLVFDLLRPSDERNRKTLEYVLGYLADRDIVWWRLQDDRGARHYHVAFNPEHGKALARVAANGAAPGF